MPGDISGKPAAEGEPSDLNPSRRQLSLMDSEISPQNNDILLQIASLIRLAEGFRLGFVKCNQPVQCRQMASRLKEMLASEAKIINVELKEPVSSLRRAVLQALESDKSDNAGKRAIMVFGFEHSLPSEGPALALDELNQSRENFPKSFSDPVFIWLPDYALTRMAREAPDFWGWRSGVFEFYPELRLMTSIEKTVTHDAVADSLSLDEKRVRAAALEGLIGDYYELQRGKRENQALAAVLHSLGNLRYQFGKYDVANKLYQESLRIKQDLGDNKGISASLHQLGRLAQDTGDLAEARRLYQESLEISQELGDKSGISASLHQLGTLAQDTGDLAEARKLYQKSLKISQELGDKKDVSASLHQLGMLAQDTGDLTEARKLYYESLRISHELGDESGISASLHQLGMLAEDTGDLAEARKFYLESLKIFQELGDKSGVSKSLHQLGNLACITGDLAEARRLYQESMKISQELGDKNGLAITSAQLALLDEKECNMNSALELIRLAESIFVDLKSPMAAQAQNDRERLEMKSR
jgi:tetratricopeptide (TPR) repeat protein